MAKKSKIARNEQRKVIVERYASKRLELKKTLVDPNATDEAREAARLGLQKLPRDASPIRLRNRDIIDDRGDEPKPIQCKPASVAGWGL
jgi:small subunit ribosomal protein S14